MFENSYKAVREVTDVRKVYFQKASPQEVWHEVLTYDKEEIQSLCVAMSQLVYEVGVPKWLVHASAAVLYHGVYRWWGHYVAESDYLALNSGYPMSKSLMAFLQRQYTLAHMGCSVVMAWDEENKQMVHYRSLDWKGAEDIASATRKFSFINETNIEVAQVAGITAMVGVLTGVKKGFSIAINYAPWKRSARFSSDPTFLIRQLLEDESVQDYERALEAVIAWQVGSPCFISICGVERGQAAVVELSVKHAPHVRTIGNASYLVQTNHYDLESSPFVEHNEKPYSEEMDEEAWYKGELLEHSQQRACVLAESIEKSHRDIISTLQEAYMKVPVLNWETAQLVEMRPIAGEMKLFACYDK